MHDSLVNRGGCLCGQVCFEARGPVTNLCFCHCESCRRAVGAAPVAWGTVEEAGFAVTHGELAVYHSSPKVRRGFCRHCGTSLTYQNSERAGEVDITLASLDEAAALVPVRHIWVQDQVAWPAGADGLPRYATVPRASEQ
ncbi:MAG TPA: GFA family protein [Steroidobacteraceae bacterium]